MDVGITAIGTANPAYKQDQATTAEILSTGLRLKPSERRFLKSVYKSSGIEFRHSVLSDYCQKPGEFIFFPNNADTPFPSTSKRMQAYKEHALPLAIMAINNCLNQNVMLDTSIITHLITISCTGMYAPGIDIEIIKTLHLNSHTQRTAINFMGCYGAFNGIKLAHDICRADSSAVVLVVAIELCTLHIQQDMKISNIVSSAIFADGAAAIIIQSISKKNKYFKLNSFYCDLIPQTDNEMAWTISDQGFDILLSSYVPEVIQSGIAAFTHNLLEKNALVKSDIGLYAIHPGGLRILRACESALNITAIDNRYSYHVLNQYGNMSSATILFVLKEIWDDLTLSDHHKNIFSCAFGPGLTLESMLLGVHYDQD